MIGLNLIINKKVSGHYWKVQINKKKIFIEKKKSFLTQNLSSKDNLIWFYFIRTISFLSSKQNLLMYFKSLCSV